MGMLDNLPVLIPTIMETGAGGGATPAYDDLSSLVHVYEMRRVLTSYTGSLIRLRRGSDDAESDFGYTSSNDLDTAAITTWLGGASGYIVTWYDQAGGNNLAQATSSKQPLFVASGQNGRPIADFDDGASQFMQVTYSGALSQPFTVYVTCQLDEAQVTGNAPVYVVDGSTAARMIMGRVFTTENVWAWYAGSWQYDGGSDSDWHVWTAIFNGASSELFIDGISRDTGDVNTQNAVGLTVGAQRSTADNFWHGGVASIVIADPVHDASNQAAALTAINSYWGVY